MNLSEAADNFRRATRHCDNLIAVHRGHGGPSPGRRDEEVSINRAIVVLTVAAWQAVVQDYTRACIDLSAPTEGSPLSLQTYAVMTGRVMSEIGSFSTPNAQNTRKLLIGAGYDPRPEWTWRQRGGRGRGLMTWTPSQVDDRIDEWLRVRHAIAHGHETLPKVVALRAVRERPSNPRSHPTLRLVDARQCLAFFQRVTRITGRGIGRHLGVTSPWPSVPL